MRSPSVAIERVSYWLRYFTLAELFFVLEEDARIYPFDKFRIRKIALALRHTFASDQSDNEVKMLIKDLSTEFSQARPLNKPTSISSITVRKSQHLLVPFRSTCPVCNNNLNENNAQQQGIRLYCSNGSVMIATMFTLRCNHVHARCSRNGDLCPITIYPNFIRTNNRNIYTYDSLYFGSYVYLGGDVAVERSIAEKFIAHLVYRDLSMSEYADTLNQEAINGNHIQLTPIDRRALANILQAFLTIQLHICYSHDNVDTPSQLTKFNEWAWCKFPHLLSCFIYLWTNHSSIIGSCGDHCSKCLVVDGHQKTRRRICAFKDVKVNTDEMMNVVIGCCRTPIPSSRYCEYHNNASSAEEQQRFKSATSSQDLTKRKVLKFYKKRNRNANSLNATGCRTLKARSNDYINKCTRSFGLIALITNCRIITSFSELYRSETLKEIINLFAITYRVAGKLAPTLVYDDGCHLVKYVINHIGKDLTRTPAMKLLASTPVSVDRSHFRNHVGKFCRETMNPNNNRLLDNVNTQAAEQTFSWLKQYANIMSNLGYLRAPLFMLILFHSKNMSSVKKSVSSVFNVVSLCPEVSGVSLCHMKHVPRSHDQRNNKAITKTIEQNPNSKLRPENFCLPKGITDWDSKLLEIMNTNKAN
ncbi:unnamed protein product [Adineta ricciae]|nr:unnamed protein product [Adineta ricciae]